MSAPLHQWLSEPLSADVHQAVRRLLRTPCVKHVALMPDVHLAHDVCIGTVVGTEKALLPAAIGSDIGCGVATLRCTGTAADLQRTGLPDAVLAALAPTAPIHRHPHRQALPPPLDPHTLSEPALQRLARREGAVQFGTVGRGNHFLEIQADTEDRLWIMAHTGSRAMGPAIQRIHTEAAAREGRFAVIDARSEAGRRYLADVQWALDYAAASRQALLMAAARVLRDLLGCLPQPESYVDCAHNTVGLETHDGHAMWVHRKGAIEASEGQAGLIPGSMGTATYHVVGRGHPHALASSSHGAGRRYSRTEARQRIGARQLRSELRDVVARPRPNLAEEAPGAYRDIDAVMRAQRDLTRIVGRVRPLISHKG